LTYLKTFFFGEEGFWNNIIRFQWSVSEHFSFHWALRSQSSLVFCHHRFLKHRQDIGFSLVFRPLLLQAQVLGIGLLWFFVLCFLQLRHWILGVFRRNKNVVYFFVYN
jgi:hypothetical protein